MYSVEFCILLIMLTGINCSNKARYDYYQLYRVHLDNEEQVSLMQELEDRSDSYTFYGHARHVNQDLTILVAASKVADFLDLIIRYDIAGKVLVSFIKYFTIKCKKSQTSRLT